MSDTLNNVTTQAAYSEATSLACEGAIKLNIQVYNAGIFYKYMPWQRQHPGRGGFFNPEVFLGPGTYLLARRAQAVAVRSAVAGEPAQVTIEALGPDD